MAKTTQRLRAQSRPSRTKPCEMAVQPVMCATCPFREGSPYAYLAPELAASALTEASRVCHSTGSNNGVYHRTGKPPAICRGSRDIQLKYFVSMGLLHEPTDEAWAKKWAEISKHERHTANQPQ